MSPSATPDGPSSKTSSAAAAPAVPQMPTRRGDRNESRTVLRACEVLRAFRVLGEDLSLSDVIDRTSLPKTTVFRLLRTLVHGDLLERASPGVYRNRFGRATAQPFRIGFAAQGDSGFCRAVMQSVETAAAREHVDLITVNNRYSAREALRNADLLIKERVDLVLEYQTHERVAPVIASKFLEANTPVIAIEIPHPGADLLRRQQLQGRPDRREGSRPLGARALGRQGRSDRDAGAADRRLVARTAHHRPYGWPVRRTAGRRHIPVAHLNGRGDFGAGAEDYPPISAPCPGAPHADRCVNDICARCCAARL